MNVPARWGQSPFTNITLDWVVPNDLKIQIPTKNNHHFFEGNFNHDLVVKANERGVDKPTDLRYEHFQEEMNLINKAYYTVMTEGMPMVNHLLFQFQQ